MSTRTIAAPLGRWPGQSVTACSAVRESQPELHLEVATETGTPIGPLRERITGHAPPRLRQALELHTLPADVLLQIDSRAGGRAR